MSVPLILFCGPFLEADSIPPYVIWMKYISWFYYGLENLLLNQWSDAGACYQDWVSLILILR